MQEFYSGGIEKGGCYTDLGGYAGCELEQWEEFENKHINKNGR